MAADHPRTAPEHRDDLVVFEQEWHRRSRQSRLVSLGWIVLASLVLLLSFELSEAGRSSVDAGWTARIASFADQMIPDLQLQNLFGGRGDAGSLASWFYDLPVWLVAMRETIAMAFVGSVIGGIFALLLSFYGARNLNKNRFGVQFVRRSLDLARTIPDVIMALIFAAAFNLGPVAGTLTLIISTVGSLGKLFSESLENAEMRQVDSIAALGGNWFLQIRYGVIPQILPQLLSYWLLRLEINLSAAAALGIVGAGGIGMELQRAISFTQFDTYLAILLLIIGYIVVLDMLSEALRHRLIGRLNPPRKQRSNANGAAAAAGSAPAVAQ
ncbi:MAG: phosphonate ABC transporter, permease protein PhnE [Alphaproteobacteria bacterium]|nr:phosphonate ABC transporter, permease protein PhnE [Alphaproteobacteria bacterium]